LAASSKRVQASRRRNGGLSASVELPRWAPEYLKMLADLEQRCGLTVDQDQVLKDILAETVIEIEL
jgi:hypothetical protein